MKMPRGVSFAFVAIVSLQAACSGSGQQPPPREPVSTTRTTSAALGIEDTPSTPVPPETPVRDPEKAAPNAPAIGQTEADRRLSEKIRQHLAQSPAVSGIGWNRVQIVTVDGNVTLVGELPTTADAVDIEHAVREVRGVRGVTNEIHLPPVKQ